MSKYKIGDVVKFDADLKRGYGRICDLDGDEYEVELLGNLKGTGHYGYGHIKGNYWFVDESKIIEIARPEIHITTDGRTTTAVLKQCGEIKKATAKCNANDEFDFKTGAELALSRLYAKPFVPHLENEGGDFYGNIGEPTKMKDITGELLFVGDIVVIVSKSDSRSAECFVVNDNSEMFIMGIKNACKMNGTIKEWIAVKKKSYKDLKHGDNVDGMIKAVLHE